GLAGSGLFRGRAFLAMTAACQHGHWGIHLYGQKCDCDTKRDTMAKVKYPTETPMLYKVPLILTPQPEGGFTVTSPVLPELVSEGDTAEEAVDNARDALTAVVEAYQDLGRALPPNVQIADANGPVWVETLVTAP